MGETRARRTGTMLASGVPSSDAGWSSPVARWAHNPKVAGSNPAPATKFSYEIELVERPVLFVSGRTVRVLSVFTVHQQPEAGPESSSCLTSEGQRGVRLFSSAPRPDPCR